MRVVHLLPLVGNLLTVQEGGGDRQVFLGGEPKMIETYPYASQTSASWTVRPLA